MNVTVETTPESDARFQVQLDWKEINTASDAVYRRLAQKYSVPGFRPGKAPRAMLERMLGNSTLYEEAIDDLVEEGIRNLAREQSMTLLAAPHAHVHEVRVGEAHTVTVTIPVLQHGELADIRDIRVEVTQEPVTDTDIDAVIERYRTQKAQPVPVERPAQLGDRVTVALKVTVEGKDLINTPETEFDLVETREGGMYVGMDEHLIGMKDGETREFTTTLPEDYGKAEYAGKPANYVVTLNKTTVNELPEVDEEFAREAGQFDSVDAMRTAIKADLERQRTQQAERTARDKAIDALIERLTLVVPPALAKLEAEDMFEEMGSMLSRQQISLDQFLTLTGQTKEQYLEQSLPEAERRIKQRRALEILGEQHAIAVNNREIQSLLDYYAAMGSMPRTRVGQLKPTQLATIRGSLVREKALEQFLGQALVYPEGMPSANAEAAAIAGAALELPEGEMPVESLPESALTTEVTPSQAPASSSGAGE